MSDYMNWGVIAIRTDLFLLFVILWALAVLAYLVIALIRATTELDRVKHDYVRMKEERDISLSYAKAFHRSLSKQPTYVRLSTDEKLRIERYKRFLETR